MSLLFFGQRPYSPVNVVGEIEGDPTILAKVEQGDAIRVAKCEELDNADA